MIDKALVKKRFSKSLKTYNDNAIIQKQMADKLITLLPFNYFDSIFEAGCATGILTDKIKIKIRFNHYSANDIVEESQDYIRNIIPDSSFFSGDIETLEINKKYDLIISNACLQWCNNIEATIIKLLNCLNNNGILAVSIFGNENLKEIKEIFNIENKNYDMDKLKTFLSDYNAKIIEEKIELTFNSASDILKHIKNTGANAIEQMKLTKSKLIQIEEEYNNRFKKQNGMVLTYNPVYIVIRHSCTE